MLESFCGYQSVLHRYADNITPEELALHDQAKCPGNTSGSRMGGHMDDPEDYVQPRVWWSDRQEGQLLIPCDMHVTKFHGIGIHYFVSIRAPEDLLLMPEKRDGKDFYGSPWTPDIGEETWSLYNEYRRHGTLHMPDGHSENFDEAIEQAVRNLEDELRDFILLGDEAGEHWLAGHKLLLVKDDSFVYEQAGWHYGEGD